MNSAFDSGLMRQRLCHECKAFVTFHQVDLTSFACPLCGAELKVSPNLVKVIPARWLAKVIAKQHKLAQQIQKKS